MNTYKSVRNHWVSSNRKSHCTRSGLPKNDSESTLDNKIPETGAPLSLSGRKCTPAWPPVGFTASSTFWTSRQLYTQKTPVTPGNPEGKQLFLLSHWQGCSQCLHPKERESADPHHILQRLPDPSMFSSAMMGRWELIFLLSTWGCVSGCWHWLRVASVSIFLPFFARLLSHCHKVSAICYLDLKIFKYRYMVHGPQIILLWSLQRLRQRLSLSLHWNNSSRPAMISTLLNQIICSPHFLWPATFDIVDLSLLKVTYYNI